MVSALFSFHAERAIDIITHILPEDHLLLASSKRVKGEVVFQAFAHWAQLYVNVLNSVHASYNDDIMLYDHFPQRLWVFPFSSGLLLAAAFWRCLMSSVGPKHFIFDPFALCLHWIKQIHNLYEISMLAHCWVYTVLFSLSAHTFAYLSSSDTGGNCHRLPQQGDWGAPSAGGTWPPPLLPAAGKKGFRRVQRPDSKTLR